jgi:hypothetical protein
MIQAKHIALFAVVAAQVSAFADDKADKDMQKSLVPYGLIQATSYLADSEYGTAPDFILKNLRFGMKVSEGITRAQFETQIFGNLSDRGETTAAAYGLNGVGIRRADVGLALSSGTTISLGRTRLGGADAWGIDATSGPLQFGSIDGAAVEQKVSLGDKNELTLALGVGNSMGVPSGKDARSYVRPLKSERGVIVGARAKFEGIAVAAYYGMEKNQVQQTSTPEEAVVDRNGDKLDANGKPIPKDADGKLTAEPAQLVKLKKVMTASDVSHFEGSLGYNQDNWSVGGWYQSIVKSGLKTASFVDDKFKTADVTPDDAKFGAKAEGKNTSTIMGIGFNTDSSLIGYTDVLQKGGLLTFGGSIEQEAERKAEVVDSEEAKADKTTYAFSVGYQAGGFLLELGHALKTAQSEVFNSKNAEQGDAAKPTKKMANTTFLTGTYSF